MPIDLPVVKQFLYPYRTPCAERHISRRFLRFVIDFLVLGTGAMTPLPTRWLSSVIVRCNGQLTLFDCGEGTQSPLRRYGWGFKRIGAICLSHCHADHIAGLPGILISIANAVRTEPVTVYGPPGTKRMVEGLLRIVPQLCYPLTVEEVGSGSEPFELPGGMFGQVENGQHRVPQVTYRVDVPRGRRFDADKAKTLGVPVGLWRALQSGKIARWPDGVASPEDVLGPERAGLSFAFVTDTRPVPSFPAFLKGVDLMICEGTYGDSADRQKAIQYRHMTYTDAANLAFDSGAKSLLLTHFSPAMEDPKAFLLNAASIFPNTIIGQSGLSITLSFADEEDDASKPRIDLAAAEPVSFAAASDGPDR
jgi:ribonuclease Z